MDLRRREYRLPEPKVVLSVRPCPMLAGVARMAVLACAQITMSRRQWSLAPHSSTPFMALTVMLSWKPREAKT